MSTVALTTFDPAAIRQELLNTPEYCAAPSFGPSIYQWRRPVKEEILCAASLPGNPVKVLLCTIVGAITGDRPSLETHGSFNHRFPDKPARSKLQFTLECPVGDVGFEEDFAVAFSKMEVAQDQVSLTENRMHFLNNNAIKSMRLNFPIWEARDSRKTYKAEDNTFSASYKVNSGTTPYFEALKSTHIARCMTVYDVNGNLNSDPHSFGTMLVGSLVEVTFSLIHYHIAATVARPIANDTFTTIVESVSVLRKPAPLLESPFRSNRSPTKPPRTPQTPQGGLVMGSRIKQPVFSTAVTVSTTSQVECSSASPSTSTNGVSVVVNPVSKSSPTVDAEAVGEPSDENHSKGDQEVPVSISPHVPTEASSNEDPNHGITTPGRKHKLDLGDDGSDKLSKKAKGKQREVEGEEK